MKDSKVICQLCCLKLVKKKKTKPQYVSKPLPADPYLDMKAMALTSVLFLQDDLFALKKVNKLDREALTTKNIPDEQYDEQFVQLFPESFVLKAYLLNNSRQIARLGLLAGLQMVSV
ncbi:unnamed protein product [Echinostoma caproni]|uniref:DDE_Tnp_1_7 domain-containing protein n=1 Tax=Echinostoma caproni TaxID=27848 RepID=A0A183AMC6_9TREM|nr:unnamed protein product [Echinostoma caproni]